MRTPERGLSGVVVPRAAMWLEALGRGLRGSLFPFALRSSGACLPAASLLSSSSSSSSASSRSGCWSCGLALPSSASASARFCPSCRALQPPDPAQDHFRLMGCDRSFRLDLSRLQQTFRDLQRSLHPDFFSQRPQVERDFSEQHSSQVNKAYRTLLDPLSRGIYLLELSGVALEQGTDPGADPGFLSEIMEANERISEAHDESKMEEVERFIAAKQEELTESVTKAFDRGDLQEAKRLLAKMKYFANLEEKAKAKRIPP